MTRIILMIIIFPFILLMVPIIIIATLFMRLVGVKDADFTFEWWKEYYQKSQDNQAVKGYPRGPINNYDAFEDPDWYPGKGKDLRKQEYARRRRTTPDAWNHNLDGFYDPKN